jgi:two-component system chemotaxis response regulator CheB
MNMQKKRVLVVEDSLTVRRHLVQLLADDPDIDVIGEAQDGKEGIEMCLNLRPDVVTLDLNLPVLSGLAATEYIMAYCPTPILIVSSATNRAEHFKTYDALRAGALDALDKPSGDEIDDAWEERFISTIKLVSRIQVITHLRGRRSLSGFTSASLRGEREQPPRAIGIGVSTGGPAALVEILGALPKAFPIPIVLVIHLGKLFSSPFASWLDGQCALSVRYARDGEPVPNDGCGSVILAPPDRHLILRGGRFRLTDDPEHHFCRPSIDVLFRSMADELGSMAAACLLTGMGSDGAEGLLAIRQAGGKTIAQDEKSSVIFGMPKVAIAMGAAEEVLPLNRIASALLRLANPIPNKGSRP